MLALLRYKPTKDHLPAANLPATVLRKPSPPLQPEAYLLFAFLRHLIPPLQSTADGLSQFRREALEAFVVLKNLLLLFGRSSIKRRMKRPPLDEDHAAAVGSRISPGARPLPGAVPRGGGVRAGEVRTGSPARRAVKSPAARPHPERRTLGTNSRISRSRFHGLS